MIIKSMARKEPSFQQLIEYMHKQGSSNISTTSRNIFSENTNDIILEFEENAKYLKKRKKGNYLYHEVITIPKQENLSLKKGKKILIDIADKYLEKRAENLLSYGVIHTDTNNLHIHLIISANELLSDRRYRLSKKKFSDIQKEIELYKMEKYPELETSKIYNQDKEYSKIKSLSQREYEVIKRGGTSKKQEIIDISRDIIARSKNQEELEKSFEKIQFRFYTRGKNTGLENIQTGRKYRLKTLGLEEEYIKKLEEFRLVQERLNELNKQKDTNDKVKRVIELNESQQERLQDLKKLQSNKDKDLEK